MYSDAQGFSALERKMRGSRSDFVGFSNNLQTLSSGVTPYMLDPSKGVLSSAYVQVPTVLEKVEEGGVVGYVIIGLGILALLIALFRILVLMGVEAKVKKQARDLKRPSLGNPLGRVIKVYQDNPNSDPESMELRLGEAMFGAGDPQTMAGGISQALVTTVLGLVVAIPTVFAHWLASSRARRIEGIIEEHAAGLIAEQYEVKS